MLKITLLIQSIICTGMYLKGDQSNSLNLIRRGESKTWYGIPASDADAFEEVMRSTMPELFEANPDLLFHLTTMLPPQKLLENNVSVYKLHQDPGEFVITFPRAYHGGFNQGFNCAEAVNFALPDWLPFGRQCVELYKMYKKAPVFSNDELILSLIDRDLNAESAQWWDIIITGILSHL